MVYTFAELKRQVLVKLDEIGQTATEEIVGNELNNAHAVVCDEAPWPWMVDQPRRLTTTVGVREFTFPAYTQKVLYVMNITRGGVPVTAVTDRQYAALKPVLEGRTGPAEQYVRWGLWAVKRQPSSAMLLRLVSDSPLDTGSTYAAAVKGLDASGEERAIVLTPSGTAPVDATVALVSITSVVKSQEWNGNLTLSNVAGDETYLTLFPWELGRQYPVAYLIQEPTTAETLEVRVRRQPLLMVNDYDVPMVPGPEVLVLVYETLIQMSTYLRDLNAQDIGLWRERRDALKRNLYAGLLDGDLQSEPDQIHQVDDGWDDTF